RSPRACWEFTSSCGDPAAAGTHESLPDPDRHFDRASSSTASLEKHARLEPYARAQHRLARDLVAENERSRGRFAVEAARDPAAYRIGAAPQQYRRRVTLVHFEAQRDASVEGDGTAVLQLDFTGLCEMPEPFDDVRLVARKPVHDLELGRRF